MPTDEVAASIAVQVMDAQVDQVWSCDLTLPVGTTVAVAVARSGWQRLHAGVELADDCLGVFGRRVKPEHVLRDGDRVEIYRRLLIDPMEARRRRAADRPTR